jgi:hypothetical protein
VGTDLSHSSRHTQVPLTFGREKGNQSKEDNNNGFHVHIRFVLSLQSYVYNLVRTKK